MKYTIKKSVFKTAAIVFISFILNVNLSYSYVWHNGAGSSYAGSGAESAKSSNTIEIYLIEAGGFYLNADAGVQKLLAMVELYDLRGVDYTELKNVLTDAAGNIEKTIETYNNLINTAEITPYNEPVLNKLKAFDYKGFMVENALNSVIFTRVEDFLKKGDITGLFKKVRGNLKEIDGMLKTIHEKVSLNEMPQISALWSLNEKFSNLSLFGSYTARVFSAVL
ncbi:MAG: hypothetical protein KAW12_11335 [Candidatus Aminicenantes bacterium]|nr:hypothetical protein [Candidatus Aminicenantes bacterium]